MVFPYKRCNNTIAKFLIPDSRWYRLLAPVQMPREIVMLLNAAINKSMMDPDIRKRIAQEVVYPADGTPEELGAFMKDRLARHAKMIRDAGLKKE
ncbi:MAG: tripartite tricarboxylate transporter substrate-binding protein [Burkholderiales bacterium]